MSKEKICHVCQAFIDRNYIPEMVLHINKLIKYMYLLKYIES